MIKAKNSTPDANTTAAGAPDTTSAKAPPVPVFDPEELEFYRGSNIIFEDVYSSPEQLREIQMVARSINTRTAELFLYCTPQNYAWIFRVVDVATSEFSEALGAAREYVFAFLISLSFTPSALYTPNCLYRNIYAKLGALYDYDPDVLRAAVTARSVLNGLHNGISIKSMKLAAIDESSKFITSNIEENYPKSLS